MRYPAIHSLFIAIDLTSNCAYSCTYFHIQCNRLAILSFSNLEIVRCPAIHSTFVAINLTSDHLGIFKLFPLLHLFPHSLQLACPPIICEFSNCASSCTYFHIHCNRLAILSFSDFEILRCPASLSTLIAIHLLSYHFLIFKLCVFLHLFPHSL